MTNTHATNTHASSTIFEKSDRLRRDEAGVHHAIAQLLGVSSPYGTCALVVILWLMISSRHARRRLQEVLVPERRHPEQAAETVVLGIRKYSARQGDTRHSSPPPIGAKVVWLNHRVQIGNHLLPPPAHPVVARLDSLPLARRSLRVSRLAIAPLGGVTEPDASPCG